MEWISLIAKKIRYTLQFFKITSNSLKFMYNFFFFCFLIFPRKLRLAQFAEQNTKQPIYFFDKARKHRDLSQLRDSSLLLEIYRVIKIQVHAHKDGSTRKMQMTYRLMQPANLLQYYKCREYVLRGISIRFFRGSRATIRESCNIDL